MKTPYITTIILEGTDGVGKSTVIDGLQKFYKFRYMMYHRGDMSNMVYAEKFNRFPALTQVGLPFLHVLLTCNDDELMERINGRQTDESEKCSDVESILDQDRFIYYANRMKNDYHVIIVDTSGQSKEDTIDVVIKRIEDYVARLPIDNDMTAWNEMYDKACKKLGLTFAVRGNQPYINNIPFMSESTLQNGVYEQFSNKDYPDNFIYSLAYDITEDEVNSIPKTIDFAYVINSKINRRPEVYAYYDAFAANNKTCIVSYHLPQLEKHPNRRWFVPVGKSFGNDFIRSIAPAKATIYCGADLAYLKLQTARLYEAIIAKQIVFVDQFADEDNEMLEAMHRDTDLLRLLNTAPNYIIEAYDYIMSHPTIYQKILSNQSKYYNHLKSTINGGKFND